MPYKILKGRSQELTAEGRKRDEVLAIERESTQYQSRVKPERTDFKDALARYDEDGWGIKLLATPLDTIAGTGFLPWVHVSVGDTQLDKNHRYSQEDELLDIGNKVVFRDYESDFDGLKRALAALQPPVHLPADELKRQVLRFRKHAVRFVYELSDEEDLKRRAEFMRTEIEEKFGAQSGGLDLNAAIRQAVSSNDMLKGQAKSKKGKEPMPRANEAQAGPSTDRNLPETGNPFQDG